MKRLLLVLVLILSTMVSGPRLATAQAFEPANGPIGPSARSQNVEITLISAASKVAPGQTVQVALKQTIARGWHTYWRNPGDSGEPTSLTWTLPEGLTAGEIRWPVPSAIPFGPLVNYGYSDSVVLPVQLSIPKNVTPGTNLAIKVEANWLECADICIPGSGIVSITLPVSTSSEDGPAAREISTTLSNLPKPLPGQARVSDLGDAGLQLVINGIPANGKAYFFAYELAKGALVDFAAPQTFVQGKDGFGLNLTKSPSFPKELTGPIGGVLVVGEGRTAQAYDVSAEVTIAPAMTPVAGAQDTQAGTGLGLVQAWLFAFLGGLILNLMPCVFPILSMKALGLLEASQGDRREARRHGLFYGAGVLVCFIGLAAALIGLKAAGMAIGWGFQLQAPAVITGLAILMTLIGFNLLGFFDIGTSLQGAGSGLTRSGGATGSFMTGVLAVVVAAPCTAPFMGAALGYAAVQPAPQALSIFAALGLGFAAPFVGLTFAPGLLKALPKPGPWMVRLREVLAFPMFATAIWLIWVATAQIGQTGVLAALGGIVMAGLAVWVWRTWDSRTGRLIGLAILLLGLGGAGFYASMAPEASQQRAQAGLDGETWTPARVSELQAQGKVVFVNFTADWCVTCKVNEATVFADPKVRDALSSDRAVYLVADWTSRDDIIAQELARHGRVGVPLYLVYQAGQSEPQILPQLPSVETILTALGPAR